MMSKMKKVRSTPSKIPSGPVKRRKVAEDAEVTVSHKKTNSKKVDSPKNSPKVKRQSKYEIDLTEFKAILKKPKKNITAYAFFIKEVS